MASFLSRRPIERFHAGLAVVVPLKLRSVLVGGSDAQTRKGQRQDFFPNGNLRYRASFFEKVHLETQSKTKCVREPSRSHGGRSRLMPEWMASGTLAFLLALAGGFAVHYTLLTLRVMH
jgi:hypothetical protein